MRQLGVIEAIELALQAHEGQKRKSGEDYVIHPLAVLQKLIEIPCSEEFLSVAVLHDTLEDTWVDEPLLQRQFGSFVAEAVLYLSKPCLKTKQERIENYIQQLKRGVLWSEVVYLVKLADVWHNVQTLEFFTEQKRFEQRQEVKKYYLPFFYKHIYLVPKKYHQFCLNLIQDIRENTSCGLVLSCAVDR